MSVNLEDEPLDPVQLLEEAVTAFKQKQADVKKDDKRLASIGLGWSTTDGEVVDGLAVVDPSTLSNFLEYVRDRRGRPLSHAFRAACGLIENGIDRQLVAAIGNDDKQGVSELLWTSSAIAPLLGKLEPTGEYVTGSLNMLIDAVNGNYETHLLELRARGLFTDLGSLDSNSPSGYHLQYVRADDNSTDNWGRIKLANPAEVKERWFALLEPIRQISHLPYKRYALAFADRCLFIALGHLDIASRGLESWLSASHLGEAPRFFDDVEIDLAPLGIKTDAEVSIDSAAVEEMREVFKTVELRIDGFITEIANVQKMAIRNARGL